MIRKKIFIILILCSLICTTMTSCYPQLGDGSKVIFIGDFTNCNVYNHGHRMAFSVWCIYKGRKPDVEFISFDNVTATSALVEMSDITIDLVQDKSYKGYKGMSLGFFFDFSMLEPGMSLEINSILLSVNGEDVVINMDDQIKYTEVDPDNGLFSTGAIFDINVPVTTISDGDALVYPVRFLYLANEDVVINSFEFNDYYDITKSEILVDNIYVGSVDDAFPIELKKDSKISITMDITLRDGYERFSEYLLDSFLHYTDSAGEDKILLDTYAIQAIGNYDDYCSMIDYLIESQRANK